MATLVAAVLGVASFGYAVVQTVDHGRQLGRV
jgi:hypothetical protein